MQLFLDLFGSADQVTNKLLIPTLTCQTDLNTYNKYITTSGDAPACGDCLSDERTRNKRFCESIPDDGERQI